MPTPGTCRRGDQVAAAGAAVRVAMHLLFDTALMAPVRGWLARAERLLEGLGETPAHAWLAVVRAYERMLTGDLAAALGTGPGVPSRWVRSVTRRRAPSHGSRRHGCSSWTAMSSRVWRCSTQAGVATVSGDLDPLSTGIVYCELVCALQGLAQYDVAEEWTEAMERWCETNAIGSLHGRCRVHRAEILRLRGSCNEAEGQALIACEELRPYLRRELGWPLNELGRIRLHKGDITGAEEALLAAHRAGWDPQPALALVRLAQGDVATAAASIRDAVERPLRVPSKERPPNTDLQRAPLLEAQVEIEIAAGDIGRARSAADELELIAARFESKALGRQRRRSLAEGCGSPTAMRRARNSPCQKRCDSGTKSAPRTRRRWHASASPRPMPRAAASTGPVWSAKRPAQSSKGSKPRRLWPHRWTWSTTMHPTSSRL